MVIGVIPVTTNLQQPEYTNFRSALFTNFLLERRFLPHLLKLYTFLAQFSVLIVTVNNFSLPPPFNFASTLPAITFDQKHHIRHDLPGDQHRRTRLDSCSLSPEQFAEHNAPHLL